MVTIYYDFETVQIAGLIKKALKEIGIKVRSERGPKFFVDMMDSEYLKSLTGNQQSDMIAILVHYTNVLDETNSERV